jgi:sugar/nucleoside kinase (ribokinase family)
VSIGKVACVGIYVVDAIAKPIDRVPRTGTLELFDHLTLHVGGCANNAAIAMARLGLSVAAYGKIGRDAFGDIVMDGLLESGVDASAMLRCDTNTGITFVMVNSGGERTFYHTVGANGALVEEDLPADILDDARVLVVSGALLMPRFDGEPTARLVSRAAARGVTTVLDTAYDSQGRWLEAVGPSLPRLDFFMPSLEEAQPITGQERPEDVAGLLLDRGVGTVVLKMGADRSYIRNAELEARLPALDVPAADTTGAGDAYVAGFVAGHLRGWDLERCGHLGTATGVAAISAIGTTTGLRDFDVTLALWSEATGTPFPE